MECDITYIVSPWRTSVPSDYPIHLAKLAWNTSYWTLERWNAVVQSVFSIYSCLTTMLPPRLGLRTVQLRLQLLHCQTVHHLLHS